MAGVLLAAGFFAIGQPWASAQAPVSPVPEATVADPLGLRCVVTLDPGDSDRPTASSEVRRANGFTDINTTEGVLVRLDPEWLVLKDGNYENWIPRAKVLMMRVSR